MVNVKELQEELRMLREKRDTDAKVKQLKKQIKAEKFAQTKSGKVFNKIADVGDAGFKATRKFLSPQPIPQGSKKKKKGAKTPTVNDVMANIDKAVGQYNF